MREQPATTRRTAIRSIASICVGALALSSVGGATKSSAGGPSADCLDRIPSEMGVAVTRRPDVYVATVDRIVDGAHVVLLLEDGGELVDQHVAPREELPDVDEGDELIVVIAGDELVHVREIETNVADRLQERFDRLADSFDG